MLPSAFITTQTSHIKPKLFFLFLIKCILLIGIAFFFAERSLESPLRTDFAKFYISSKRLAHEISPYWAIDCKTGQDTAPRTPAAINSNPTPARTLCLGPNLNPPFFVVALLPLAALTFDQALLVWLLASIGCYRYFFYQILQNSPASAVTRHALAYGLYLFFPVFLSLDLGQVTPFLCVLLLWICRDLGRNDNRTAVWLALLLSIKPLFGTFLLFLAIANQHTLLLKTLMALLAINGIIALALDPGLYLDYLRTLGSVTWLTSNWNASLAGQVARFLEYFFSLPRNESAPYAKITVAIGLAIYALHFWVKTKDQPQKHSQILLYSILGAMFFSPLGWIYYYPILGLFLAPLLRGQKRSLKHLAPTIISLALAAFPFSINLAASDTLINSIYFASLALAFFHLHTLLRPSSPLGLATN